MERTGSISQLARNNINILEVRPYRDDDHYLRALVHYEFQWRDPSNNNHRWSKNFMDVPYGMGETLPYQDVLRVVRNARSELEN